jgi:hypothetical protein
VAVLAILSHIGENGLHVALRALHFFVHPPQGAVGLVVVKFRVGANGSPSGSRMTIFTGDREGPVRTSSGLPLRRLRWRECWPAEDQEPAQDWKKPMRRLPPTFYPRSVTSSAGGMTRKLCHCRSFGPVKVHKQLYLWPVLGQA